MEAKYKFPDLVKEAPTAQQNDPEPGVSAQDGHNQPLESVLAKIGRNKPMESVAADARSGERLELLGAEADHQDTVGAVAAVAEETAERQDGTLTSYTASAARPREGQDMSPVVARGSLHKRPLKHRWSLWFCREDEHRSGEENMMEVTSFQTLDDFWALQQYIEPASNLRQGCDYALFRYGIEPSWKDSRNMDGGHWLFAVDRSQRNLDNDWLEVLLCLIAEEFGEHSGDVCGAVVQVCSKADKIAVWTTDSSREVANLVIGRTLKEKLKLRPRHVIPYRSHADIMRTERGAEIKAKYKA
ncbi:hypothetical protein HPB48_003544 [Haemaphysalis longicornis]|uniref:EIF-4F 25 kDa subunit n=1 Tax=Haemaphysalis longicornis TaxID=44386 RepID=A0A9J6FBL7_HAELO|nr:hypothetical protein HPB48_003544 [Haemaphysalis longicornis]